MPFRSTSGWLTGLSEELQKEKDVSLAVSFPVLLQRTPLEGTAEGMEYYGFPWNGKDFTYSGKTERYFCAVLHRKTFCNLWKHNIAQPQYLHHKILSLSHVISSFNQVVIGHNTRVTGQTHLAVTEGKELVIGKQCLLSQNKTIPSQEALWAFLSFESFFSWESLDLSRFHQQDYRHIILQKNLPKRNRVFVHLLR